MRNIKYILLVSLLLFIGINVKAINKEDKVYDFANVLTLDEKTELKESIDKFIEKYDMDMVVVTVKQHDYPTTEMYADRFYDINGFSDNGVLCVIDFSPSLYKKLGFHISTTGQGIIMFDDSRIDKILDEIDNVFNKNNEDYFGMFKAFINESNYYASLGIPKSNRNVKIDDFGKPYIETRFPWFRLGFISSVISGVIVIILMLRNKMVHKSKDANLYINKDSINITKRSDQFVTTNTTRVRISTPSSSSSRGHVGGSSFHSSGGRFHGGGGRSH